MKKFRVFDFLFALGLFLFFLLPPTDPDLGWQLRCGEQIWKGQGFCSQNQFSVLLAGYPWVNHHWLYQVIIWGLWGLWGPWGLTILGAGITALAFWFFYQAIPNFRAEKIGAIGIIGVIGWGVFSFGIRSQLAGFLFFSILLWLLSRIKERPRLVFLVPVVMLAWANSHGGSVGLGVALVFLGVIRAIREIRERGWVALVLLVAVAATLVNPFGFRIYQEAWRHFWAARLDRLIAEWVPPTPVFWWLTLLGGLGVLGFLGRSQKWSWALLSLAFTILGLKARRNLPFTFLLNFFLLLSLPSMKKILGAWLKKEELRNSLSYLMLVGLLSFGFFIRLPQTIDANLSWQNYCEESSLDYPYRAVEFLKKEVSPPSLLRAGGLRRTSNIFNRYEWGGFLIWQLPEYKVFVDGRMPAWGTPTAKSPYTIYLETLQTQPGWQETLREYKIDWILISPGTFMDLLLRPSPEKYGWQEVFRDRISVIYERKN